MIVIVLPWKKDVCDSADRGTTTKNARKATGTTPLEILELGIPNFIEDLLDKIENCPRADGPLYSAGPSVG